MRRLYTVVLLACTKPAPIDAIIAPSVAPAMSQVKADTARREEKRTRDLDEQMGKLLGEMQKPVDSAHAAVDKNIPFDAMPGGANYKKKLAHALELFDRVRASAKARAYADMVQPSLDGYAETVAVRDEIMLVRVPEWLHKGEQLAWGEDFPSADAMISAAHVGNAVTDLSDAIADMHLATLGILGSDGPVDVRKKVFDACAAALEHDGGPPRIFVTSVMSGVRNAETNPASVVAMDAWFGDAGIRPSSTTDAGDQ